MPVALVIDTNILLYAANRGCPEHKFCVDFLREIVATGDICFVPENIIYEFPARGNASASFSAALARFGSG
jgi:predicted nucleic acid-binding protein